ncbi:MAG: DMT family protein [Crocosphaera sp.]|nr:DMT family protein [Crocosphaera sp.]
MVTRWLSKKRYQLSLSHKWPWVTVPLRLFVASFFMALAWLGHLTLENIPFLSALFLCWFLVLPEYFLNVSAIRSGYKFYSGAQMASFRLCSGVVCIGLVSHFILHETLSNRQLLGFFVMLVAMALIALGGSHVNEESSSKES